MRISQRNIVLRMMRNYRTAFKIALVISGLFSRALSRGEGTNQSFDSSHRVSFDIQGIQTPYSSDLAKSGTNVSVNRNSISSFNTSIPPPNHNFNNHFDASSVDLNNRTGAIPKHSIISQPNSKETDKTPSFEAEFNDELERNFLHKKIADRAYDINAISKTTFTEVHSNDLSEEDVDREQPQQVSSVSRINLSSRHEQSLQTTMHSKIQDRHDFLRGSNSTLQQDLNFGIKEQNSKQTSFMQNRQCREDKFLKDNYDTRDERQIYLNETRDRNVGISDLYRKSEGNRDVRIRELKDHDRLESRQNSRNDNNRDTRNEFQRSLDDDRSEKLGRIDIHWSSVTVHDSGYCNVEKLRRRN